MEKTLHQKPQDLIIQSAIWDTADVAQFLKMSKRKVQRLMAAGSLPYFKIGRHTRFNEFLVRQFYSNKAEEEGRE